MKKLILKWLGLDQIVATDEQIEGVVERLLQRIVDNRSEENIFGPTESLGSVIKNIEYDLNGITDNYDLSDMVSLIDDHTSAIETLEERLDAIYSPEGYELTLTAKVKEAQNG